MSARPPERWVWTWVAHNPDLSFAVLLAACVYVYFALTNGLFATHNTAFAILERFAVLGPIGLSLTLCIIAGEIDLSVGSNAALAAVIVVRFARLRSLSEAAGFACGVRPPPSRACGQTKSPDLD